MSFASDFDIFTNTKSLPCFVIAKLFFAWVISHPPTSYNQQILLAFLFCFMKIFKINVVISFLQELFNAIIICSLLINEVLHDLLNPVKEISILLVYSEAICRQNTTLKYICAFHCRCVIIFCCFFFDHRHLLIQYSLCCLYSVFSTVVVGALLRVQRIIT